MPLKAALRILADEMIHRKIVSALTHAGHNVLPCPKGLKNGDVYKLAQTEKRILMTQDKDFADSKRYPPGPTEGILSVRVFPTSIGNVLSRVETFLAGKSLSDLKGRLTVIE